MCAIFGIVNHKEAAAILSLGLYSLNHRGTDGCGVVSNDNGVHYSLKRCGLVNDVLTSETLKALKGSAAIGHTRYTTAGGSGEINLQPFLMKTRQGSIAIAHNGNLVNATDLVKSFEKQGSIFQSTSDTEVIVHLIARENRPLIEAIPHALKFIEGAYSLLILNETHLIAVRDPYGFRPLVMGEMSGSIIFASETCAFDLIGANFVREVRAGEMITVDLKTGEMKSSSPFAKAPLTRCIFEQIYFARPDSDIFDSNVYEIRKNLGRQLAKEQPCDGNIVVPVPDSGMPAAIGYAEQSGIPFEMGMVRSHFFGRSFLLPKQSIRDLAVRLKLNAIRSSVENKDIIVVDDSLVRGTTSKKIIKMFRDAGARKVHFRVSAPPTTNPCIYGIDTPTKEELPASHQTIEQICSSIKADSLAYLSLEGLLEVAQKYSGKGFCHACFSGDYPTDPKRISLL
jgi:amidophosphoribosyltransferase